MKRSYRTVVLVVLTVLVLMAATPSAHAGWYNGGGGSWSYRKKIIIDHTKVSGASALLNYPLLFNSTDADLKTTGNGGKVMNASGYDIIFTGADQVTKLAHQIESYTASSGAFVAWVGISSLSNSADTVIYMYFGNTGISTSQESASSVWDSNYVGVWHLGDAGPTNAADSTINGLTGTQVNGVTFGATGKIDSAITVVQASSQEIKVAEAASLDFGTNAFTVEAWVKTSSSTASAIVAKLTGTPPATRTDDYWGLILNANGSMTFRLNDYNGGAPLTYNAITSSTGYNDGNWHHLVGVRTDATHSSVYIDGSSTGTATPTANVILTTTGNLAIGAFDYNGTPEAPLNGTVDEVRVSNIARSSDWIATEYNNENSPGTFYSIKAGESNSAFFGVFD